MVKVRITGTTKLKNTLRRIDDATLNAAFKSMTQDIVQMDSEAKNELNANGRSGNIYRRKSVTHQASAAGEFPKTDTGELVASFSFSSKKDQNSAEVSLSNDASHAKYLEFRPTASGGRPFMRPLFQRWKKIFESDISTAIKIALKSIR